MSPYWQYLDWPIDRQRVEKSKHYCRMPANTCRRKDRIRFIKMFIIIKKSCRQESSVNAKPRGWKFDEHQDMYSLILVPHKMLTIKGEIIALQWIKLADTMLINGQHWHHQHRNKWLSVPPARVPWVGNITSVALMPKIHNLILMMTRYHTKSSWRVFYKILTYGIKNCHCYKRPKLIS